MNASDVVTEIQNIDQSLSSAQQQRLTQILDDYLVGLEEGLPPDPERLVAKHPDLAAPLRSYLSGLALLQDVAAGFTRPQASSTSGDLDCRDQRLGDFEILRQIGRGGMGIVYEARQLSLDRRVALKVLPFAALMDPKHVTRFKNEAQTAAGIDHPNIVPVYAVGSDRGVHYYAMQYIDGQPLCRAIEELQREFGVVFTDESNLEQALGLQPAPGVGVSPSTRKALLTERSIKHAEYFRSASRLAVQAAEALQAAHEHGVIHRDVKPSNMMIDGQGKLWIADFGLARVQTDVSLTRSGDLVGTMRYMSPEQALGKPALVDQRTDVYSLGATIYELITFHPLVQGSDSPTLLRHIERDEPLRPRSLNPDIPADLENIVLRAVAKSREDRYATAQELADDLKRFLDGMPTCARRPTTWERTSKWAQRHKKAVVTAMAVALIAIVGLIVSSVLGLKAHMNYKRAEEHFRLARDAVDSLGRDAAQELASIPGAESVRGAMLAHTLGYYRKFIQQAEDDPSLRADLARSYTKVGTIASQTGSREDAVTAYQKACQIFENLVEEEPESRQYLSELAVCHNNMGRLLAESGGTDEAREAYATAIETQRRLIRDFPRQMKFVRQLAQTQTNLGLLYAETGHPRQAEKCYQEALRHQRQLAETDPNDSLNLRNLAASYSNLSRLHSYTDTAQATEYAREALRIHSELVKAYPLGQEHRGNLAMSYNNLGALQSRGRQLEQAVISYRRSIEIQQQLVTEAPKVRSYRRDLAIRYNNLGLVQSKSQMPAEAEQAFRQALAIQEELVREYPHDVNLLSSIGGIYNNLAMVLGRVERDEEAAAAYAKAIRYQRQAHETAPQVTRFRDFLAKHYENYGQLLRRLNRTDEAERIATTRSELIPDESRDTLRRVDESQSDHPRRGPNSPID